MSGKTWSNYIGPEAERRYEGTEQDFDDFWDWISEFMMECREAEYPRELFSNQMSERLELNYPGKMKLLTDGGND
jgi:hypothetical protein